MDYSSRILWVKERVKYAHQITDPILRIEKKYLWSEILNRNNKFNQFNNKFYHCTLFSATFQPKGLNKGISLLASYHDIPVCDPILLLFHLTFK